MYQPEHPPIPVTHLLQHIVSIQVDVAEFKLTQRIIHRSVPIQLHVSSPNPCSLASSNIYMIPDLSPHILTHLLSLQQACSTTYYNLVARHQETKLVSNFLTAMRGSSHVRTGPRLTLPCGGTRCSYESLTPWLSAHPCIPSSS